MDNKNIVNKKLEFLSKSREFIITEQDNYFEVKFDKCYADDYACISATINKNTLKVRYYMSGIYNNSQDYEEIDIESLRKIMTFCKLLTENME